MKKVLCFGTFDIIHKGHLEFLKDAKSKGDYLIVNVISDKIVYKNKGRYPKNSQEKRAKNLKKLGIADKIIGVSDNSKLNISLIKKINPDVVVIGYDQSSNFLEKLKKILPKTKFVLSKKFAGGIHSSNLK